MVRKEIKFPDDWDKEITAAAKAEKISAAEWIRRAILARLSKAKSSKLSEPNHWGRPRKEEA